MASTIDFPPTFLVPDDRMALLVRNGLSQGLYPPGRHHLPSGRVEVRLVKPGSPDRSLLYIDGGLVAVKDAAGESGPTIHAWEGGVPEHPWRGCLLDTSEVPSPGWLAIPPLSARFLPASSR